MTTPSDAAYRDLILTEGGPTYQIEKRVGIIQHTSPRIVRRALLSIAVTWLVLLVLSALQGHAIGHQQVTVSFLGDIAAHTRFLLAVPLLLAAETIIGPRLAGAASHFVRSGLVSSEDSVPFARAVDRGLALRDSRLAEVVLILLAYFIVATTIRSTTTLASTWAALRIGGALSLTWAGWWEVLFCIPLYQFLTLRWLWRLFLWGQFLWRMSKLKLKLMPTHPDESGGIAFVGEAQRFFGIIVFAFSVTSAGVLANGILYDHIPLQHFAPAIAAFVVISLIVVLAPLLVFSAQLVVTKREGMHHYGTLATEYTSAFNQKWIVGPRNPQDELLGSGDIQSLADLGNSFGFIDKMGYLPVGPRTPIHLIIAALAPLAPLLLTMMPLKDVLELLFKLVA
jgi:hypothetical protein